MCLKQWPNGASFEYPHGGHPCPNFYLTFPPSFNQTMRKSWPLFLLLFLSIFHLTATSCCCCCDCCCCCCCPCCCCCGSNNNNQLSLGTATSAGDDLTLGNSPTAPTANSPSLGPGLLPDGSTGQAPRRPDATPFGRRRKRGFGKLRGSTAKCECQCSTKECHPRKKRQAIAMPNGATKKPKLVLPSDWSEKIAAGQGPSLGPGLLPDGSTERKKPVQKNADFFNNFFDGMNMNGMQRRKRRGIWDLLRCPITTIETRARRDSYQLGLLPVDEMAHKNTTFLRFLLGLVPDAQADSQTVKLDGTRRMCKRTGEFSNQQRFFVVPVQTLAKRHRPKGKSEENVQAVLPKPPLQFYRPVVPSPENDQERYEQAYD